MDYFWTVRIMHAPIWILNRIAVDNLIPAKMYHTISTGYAGFLGASLRRKTGRPLLLSEHGIYTKERKIDLFQSEWISDNRGLVERNNVEMAYFREKWINFFSRVGSRMLPGVGSDRCLYENNRLRLIARCAPCGSAAQSTSPTALTCRLCKRYGRSAVMRFLQWPV